MYEGWEAKAEQDEHDWQEGYDAMTAMLAEDEAWAAFLFEAFHGREY